MVNNVESSDRGDGVITQEPTSWLDNDDLYRALASRRRRRILYQLLDDDTRTLDELVTLLGGGDSTDDPDTIRTNLHHVQLPCLDEADLVTYDAESNDVTLELSDPTIEGLIEASVISSSS